MIHGDLCHELLLEKTKQKLAFDKKEDYETWKRALKEKFIELSGFDLIAENACEPQFEIVSKVQKDGYQQIRFEFYSEIGERVPCYLLIPDGKQEKYPVAITQQGHSFGFHISIGEFKNEQEKAQYGHEDFAVQAVRRGFIALAIENRGMGERTATRVSRESSVLCRFASVTALSPTSTRSTAKRLRSNPASRPTASLKSSAPEATQLIRSKPARDRPSRTLRSPHRACSRTHPSNWDSRRARQCRSHSSSTRVSASRASEPEVLSHTSGQILSEYPHRLLRQALPT
jgi:hypothetical protein